MAKLPFPLQDGEQVVLVTRRHWLYFVPRFVGQALAALVPIVALLLVVGAAGKLNGTGLKIVIGVSAIWLLIWLVRIWLDKYRYDHDLWVITNRRIVDLYAKNPLNFSMSSAALVELEDVSTSVDGLLQSAFNYGNIECQTAGEVRHFTFRQVPDPRGVAAVLERESMRAKGEREQRPPPPSEAPTQPLHPRAPAP